MRIGNDMIGDGNPCYIIAEIGVNHDGSIEKAKKLINISFAYGADAVKFQMFDADELVIKSQEKIAYQKTDGVDETQYEMLKRLELSEDSIQELYKHTMDYHMTFLCSAFDKKSVDFLDDLGVPAFKIPSGEINNFRLLEHIAKKERPIILSTGMSTLEEVLHALIPFNRCEKVLMHCVEFYPAKKDVNLKAISTMKNTFWLPVGFSDHTIGVEIPKLAVAHGANLIEKHITLDRNGIGPDHKASCGLKDFRDMVMGIRRTERILGDGIKRPTKEELEIRQQIRRSAVASVDMPYGTRITNDMVEFKRPGTGIPPDMIDEVIGKKSKIAIKKDDLIQWEMIY